MSRQLSKEPSEAPSSSSVAFEIDFSDDLPPPSTTSNPAPAAAVPQGLFTPSTPPLFTPSTPPKSAAGANVSDTDIDTEGVNRQPARKRRSWDVTTGSTPTPLSLPVLVMPARPSPAALALAPVGVAFDSPHPSSSLSMAEVEADMVLTQREYAEFLTTDAEAAEEERRVLQRLDDRRSQQEHAREQAKEVQFHLTF